jgi:hypothetical protein
MTTTSIDELAKAAELVGRLRSISVEASQTILSLSGRVEKAEASKRLMFTAAQMSVVVGKVEDARREAIEDVITIMLNATFTKTHAETLEAIRNLIPGDKP